MCACLCRRRNEKLVSVVDTDVEREDKSNKRGGESEKTGNRRPLESTGLLTAATAVAVGRESIAALRPECLARERESGSRVLDSIDEQVIGKTREQLLLAVGQQFIVSPSFLLCFLSGSRETFALSRSTSAILSTPLMIQKKGDSSPRTA